MTERLDDKQPGNEQAANDEQLVAYLDGELDESGRAAIDTALESDAALRARLQLLVRTTAMVRNSFDEVLREPVPEHLLRAATARPDATILNFRPRLPFTGGRTIHIPRRWAGFAAAASILGIVLGGSIGYFAAGPQQGAGPLDIIAGTHNLIIQSADAGQDAVFDVPAGADTKLPADIRVPDMKPWGLAFKGTRKIAGEDGKLVYQFFYTADAKQPGPITVAVWASTKSDIYPTFERRENVNLMHWRHGGRGYAIAGQANKGYMWNMAQDIAWQLQAG